MRLTLIILWLLLFPSCPQKEFEESLVITEPVINDTIVPVDTVNNIIIATDTVLVPPPAAPTISYSPRQINTGSTTPGELLAFANTLIGIPYKYASINPAIGFDCSGFITYVFNHFNIKVPRSSIDFTNIEKEISLADSKPGDIVLFTGTDSTSREVGHMGVITSTTNGEYHFIHSTSGKAKGVTITLLNNYYSFRFVKVIRIFPQK